jgi:hypothetical protein
MLGADIFADSCGITTLRLPGGLKKKRQFAPLQPGLMGGRDGMG